MITSTSNPRVRQVVQWQSKAKERRKSGVFLAEGMKMLEEAPEEWLREIYLTEDCLDKARANAIIWKKLLRKGYETVSEEVFRKMSDTQSPQGVLMVLKQPQYRLEELLKQTKPLFVVLEDLQDPGNLGTIIRTGEGAGITGVIMTSGTVDVFNPKVIRATMGSIYRVPFVYIENIEETIKQMQNSGICIYAAHLKGEKYYDDFALEEPTAFLIGNEGNGLRKETADLANSYLKIPMEGSVESLNAAIAAALLMYEAHRQRNSKCS